MQCLKISQRILSLLSDIVERYTIFGGSFNYNGVIARTYELEKDEAVLKEEIKVANHRIDDLEQLP